MIFILEVIANKLEKAEILQVTPATIPLKKNGWNFNWKQIYKDSPRGSFCLRRLSSPDVIEGVVQFEIMDEIFVMNNVEVAPHNLGRGKMFDYVAGCLIAFCCRESFKVDGAYKGCVAFQPKTTLYDLYEEKYGASRAIGGRMFFTPEAGLRLIHEYLQRTKEN